MKNLKVLNYIPKSADIIAIFGNSKFSVIVFKHEPEKQNKVFCVSYTSPISLDANHHFFINKEDAINEFSRIVNIILSNK